MLDAEVADPGGAVGVELGGGQQEPGTTTVEAPRPPAPRCRRRLAPPASAPPPSPASGPAWRTTIGSATVTPAGTSTTIGSAARAWCSQVRASAAVGQARRAGRRPSSPTRDPGPAQLAVLDAWTPPAAGVKAVEVEVVDRGCSATPPPRCRAAPPRRTARPPRRAGGPAGPGRPGQRWRRGRTCSGGPHSRSGGRTGPRSLQATGVASGDPKVSACGGRSFAGGRLRPPARPGPRPGPGRRRSSGSPRPRRGPLPPSRRRGRGRRPGSSGVGGVTSVPWLQFTSASRRANFGQSAGQRHGASGARSRSHFRTVSPFGYVRLSKYLQSWRIGTHPVCTLRSRQAEQLEGDLGRSTSRRCPPSGARSGGDHSTAYSIGSVRVTGSMKPLTIMPMACSSERPRLIR